VGGERRRGAMGRGVGRVKGGYNVCKRQGGEKEGLGKTGEGGGGGMGRGAWGNGGKVGLNLFEYVIRKTD